MEESSMLELSSITINELVQYCPETIGIPLIYIGLTLLITLIISTIPIFIMETKISYKSLLLLELVIWWNMVPVLTFSYHEYIMWSLEPNFNELVECTLLKDLVEIFIQRVIFLFINLDVFNGCLENTYKNLMYLNMFRTFMITIIVLPISFFRFLSIAGASVLFSWAFFYLPAIALLGIYIYYHRSSTIIKAVPFKSYSPETEITAIVLSTFSNQNALAAEVEKSLKSVVSTETVDTEFLDSRKNFLEYTCIAWIIWSTLVFATLAGYYYSNGHGYMNSLSLRSDIRIGLSAFIVDRSSFYQNVIKYFL